MGLPVVDRAGALGRRATALAGPVVGAVVRPLRADLSALLDRVVPEVVTALLRRVDLTELVRRNVDLDRLVAEVDLDAAAARLDLDPIVGRLDLTRIVRERVDLDQVVGAVDLDAAAARLDVDAVARRLDVDAVARRLDIDAVIARIDLVGLAEEVIAAVDLPEIIRDSTGSVASDAVRGVRMQGISGDEAVGRAMDRLRHLRSRPATSEP